MSEAQTETAADANREVLPIFPLGNVLLPQGRMKLRIFEARYMDMIAACMQANSAFGICLIEHGNEVGEAAQPHRVGVEARVIDWDMAQQGMLGITVSGGRRFRIADYVVTPKNTVEASIDWLSEADMEVPAEYASMQSLLQLAAADKGQEVIAAPYRFDDANWVGYRFTEILPIPPLARLRLLELEDPTLRLSIIFQYLSDHKLLGR
ncbi:LON peptidase substrate-binding domain-containing protein [Uliginosibacterium sp. H3]|uniref:LON peptidase substrate-binding domain-containing protein n=1 Tax=Uliginosibacterium silvisoli TaxID=3114758 RepID=A0ABU6JYY7_9RHOO|nr:LON peptidase substrate-binding domain-containing protein [Uliginosibacterium sp. H3]